MPYPAHGSVLYDSTRVSDKAHTAPPAEQAERWRLLQHANAEALAERMGFELEHTDRTAELTELDRYPTVTTASGRTYAAQPWPDD